MIQILYAISAGFVYSLFGAIIGLAIQNAQRNKRLKLHDEIVSSGAKTQLHLTNAIAKERNSAILAIRLTGLAVICILSLVYLSAVDLTPVTDFGIPAGHAIVIVLGTAIGGWLALSSQHFHQHYWPTLRKQWTHAEHTCHKD
jgi:hypothetical protein